MTQTQPKRDIYDEASAIIAKAQTKEKSIKSLVYDSNSQNIRQLYALTCEALKYASIIDKIMENTAFLQGVAWMDRNLALVLLYDFLFGKKLAGACSGKYRKAVMKKKKDLKAELMRMREEKGVKSSKDLLPSKVRDEVAIPRYVRVNLLKTNVEDVMASFLEAGYTCIMTPQQAAEEREGQTAQDISNLSADVARTLGQYEFAVDLHLDDVLVFAAGTDFHSHPLFLNGHIILMDKASCIPAHVLLATPGSHVIDSCSAPGNKTSHLASLLGNEGKIYSYDLDLKRIGVMKTLLARAGATMAEPIHMDFLTSDPSSEVNSQVEYIIVDPSCSGSGMAGRKDYLVDNGIEADPARLRSLRQLQVRILSHALSFPGLKRAVYSTCSVHQEENEDVVREVLAGREDFRLVPVMQDTWDHRGLVRETDDDDDDIGALCLRASPREDRTNGFFVALFERKPGHSGSDVGTKKSKKKKSAVVDSEETELISQNDTNVEEVSDSSDVTKKVKKSKKKKKELNLSENDGLDVENGLDEDEEEPPRKKKKSKKNKSKDRD